MFLTSLFKAATPNNPSFNLNDPAAWDILGAEPAASGMRVNRNTALGYSPYYRAVSLISGAFAKLPIIIYRRGDNGKEIDKGHAAYSLLRWRPNAVQISFVWKRTLQVQALTTGNGYAFIWRDGAGRPLELLILDPDTTYPVRENGKLWYVTKVGLDNRKLAAEDVLHFPGLSYDGMMGLSITDMAREALGLGMGGQRYGSIIFKNNARPSIVLQAPNMLQPKQKQELRESWERLHAGLDNAHRTAVLDGGLTAKEISMNTKDAQLLELLKQNGIDIANFFDLPPHKLGDRQATSYASLEQENQAFLDDCLDPRLLVAEEQFRDKLLTEEEKAADSHAIEFDRRALIKANMQTRSGYFRTALGGRPWMTQNEVREEEGLNPSDDPQADDILEPLNMAQGGADNEPRDPAKASASSARPALPNAAAVLATTVRRMVGRVMHHKGKMEKALVSARAFMELLDEFEAEHAAVVTAAFADAGYPQAGDWLLQTMLAGLRTIADTTTEKGLRASVVALAHQWNTTLPIQMLEVRP